MADPVWPPPGDGQYEPMPVTAAELERWEHEAAAAVGRVRLGAFNWPMAVRSLIARVRELESVSDA